MESGPGTRLLCVPGLGLDGAAWAPTLDALPEVEAEVLLLPGYGRRPVAADDLRPAALAARLAARVAAAPAPVVLAGHSASCQVVAHAAALAPDRVSALVLVGPTTDPRAASWPRLAQRWLRTACWERPGQVPVLARTYTRTGVLWMRRTMDAARRDDVRETLQTVRAPALVVRGRRDRICPERWAAEVARHAPVGSGTVTLPVGGHMVPLTHGVPLAAAVRQFLEEAREVSPGPA